MADSDESGVQVESAGKTKTVAKIPREHRHWIWPGLCREEERTVDARVRVRRQLRADGVDVVGNESACVRARLL
jgi:hypothetical protein